MRFPVATPPATPVLRPGVVLGLSAVLLAGGIAIGWWKPWEKTAPPAREAVAPAPPRVAAAPDRAPAQTAAAPTRAEALKELQPLLPGGGAAPASAPAPPKAETPASVPAPTAAQPATAGPAVKPEAAAPVPTIMAPPQPEAKPAPAPKAEEKKPAAKPIPPKDLPPPPDRVLALAELPPALRETLPPFAIRGFVHSDDSRSRMVVINDRMLQEGDEVAAGLRLERIDPDGIVLNYKGYRFLAPK